MLYFYICSLSQINMSFNVVYYLPIIKTAPIYDDYQPPIPK